MTGIVVIMNADHVRWEEFEKELEEEREWEREQKRKNELMQEKNNVRNNVLCISTKAMHLSWSVIKWKWRWISITSSCAVYTLQLCCCCWCRFWWWMRPFPHFLFRFRIAPGAVTCEWLNQQWKTAFSVFFPPFLSVSLTLFLSLHFPQRWIVIHPNDTNNRIMFKKCTRLKKKPHNKLLG